MPTDITLVSAFLIGLVGSTHCLGMCGGIVGAFSMATASTQAMLPYVLAYNAGRIASYAAAGALFGWVSAQWFEFVPPTQAQWIARLIAAGFMIALGLYLSGWQAALGLIERLGGKLWAHLAPLGQRLLPIDRPHKAFTFGLVWGWLPCGMVYATLAWSLASGSPAQGALVMVAFGLGTLPMLLTMGIAARWWREAARQLWLRRGVGLLLIVFGVSMLLLPPEHGDHAHPVSMSSISAG